MDLCDMMEMLTNDMMLIILEHISVSNQYIVHFTQYIIHSIICQLISITSGKMINVTRYKRQL